MNPDFHVTLLCKYLDFYNIPYIINYEKDDFLYNVSLPFVMIEEIIIVKKKFMDLIRIVFYDKREIPTQLLQLFEESCLEVAEYIYLHSSFLSPYALLRLKNIGSTGRYGLLRNNTILPRLEDVTIKIQNNLLFMKNIVIKFEKTTNVKNNMLISISALDDLYTKINKQFDIFHSEHFLEEFFRDYSLKIDYAGSVFQSLVIKMKIFESIKLDEKTAIFERICIALIFSFSLVFYYHKRF